MLKRAFCLILAVLHLATFGPVKEAFAYSATSTNYNLTTGSPSQGGAERGPAGTNILKDSIGEPSAGNSSSTSYLLSSGFIPTLQSNPPEAKHIPAQFWQKNTEKKDAFDLDDYFSSPDGYTLTYTYKKLATDPKINISIDPDNHLVSFSQPADYSGTEKVVFTATDSEGNSTQSNQVALQVLGEKNQPVIDEITAESVKNEEGYLFTLIVKAIDMDGDALSFSYSPDSFFKEVDKWTDPADPHIWYSKATWQATSEYQGYYNVEVKVTDAGGLFDTDSLDLLVGINNHKPIIKKINGVAVNPGEPINLTAAESETFILKVEAEDPDNNTITLSYFWPFENPQGSEGKWVNIAYDVARPEAYAIQVVASDRIDTDSAKVQLSVTNKNRKPFIEELSVNPSTLLKNQQAVISLKGSDQDADEITFVLKKGAEVIASGPLESAGISANLSFSEEGFYQIAAVVTDGTDVTTLQRDVQVTHVDYNINPIMGDFNGDSRTDLGIQNYNDGTWQVSLSSLDDKGTFSFGAFSKPWASDFGASRDWLPVGGDFNGDGKSDVGIYNSNSGELKIALSNGSGFVKESQPWFNFPEASTTKRYCQNQEVCSGFWIFESCENVESCVDYPYSPWQPFTGNFNADKYTDFALYNRDSGQVKIVLGNSSVFKNEDLSVWLDDDASHKDYTALSGDFNGDSLADLLLFKKATGEIKVLFSNTKKFVDETACTPAGFSAKDKDLILSDFNNDGLTDIGYWDKESSKWYYAIWKGDRFVVVDSGVWLENFGTSETDSAVTGDFDGNGITDAAIFDKDQPGMECWKAHASTNKPADLLINIANGIGGQTKVEYSFSGLTEQDNLPFPVYIAKTISSINNFPDERRAVYTQSFDFTGGFFDAAEREFRGFRKVKATDPITNNYSITNFNQGREDLKQDGALKGQIEQIESYDGNNHLISRAVNTYTVTKEGRESGGAYLGFPALTEQLTTVNEENTQYITTKNTFSYDAIGNPLEQSNDLDLEKCSDSSFKPGSKKATQTTYAQAYTYNTVTKSGLNRPLETFLKDKDNNIVSEKRFAYDSRGNLSREQVVIINPITRQRSNVFTRYSYDDFGNLTTTTNARGYKVTTEYETKFSTYPAKVTNALGQSISYTYDYKLGVVTSVTDANHATTTSFYDSLGRLLYTQNTLGNVPTRYEYPDFNTKYTHQLDLKTGEYVRVKTDFIDGLGRKYQTISQGEDGAGARDVISEVFYNERGFVDRESLPHYVGEDIGQIAYTRYVYDIRGRVKQTIADFAPSEAVPTDQYHASDKDANGFIYYGPNDSSPLYTETKDPEGHKKGSLKDIYGNVLEVTEFTDKGNFKTKYEYDLQNNLVKVTDSQGQDAFTRGKAPNVTQIFYDSIGRKIKMIDPDMGTWSYEYDILGNLIRQTDAKNQVLEFIYDPLNRLILKQALPPAAWPQPHSNPTIAKRIANFFISEAYAEPAPGCADPVILARYIYDDPRKPNCIGRLSKVIDQSGSTEFFYDELGREVKSIKTVNGVIASPTEGGAKQSKYIVERQYDQFDRLTKLTYPDGEAVNYTYDTNSGLLESVVSLRGAAAGGDEAISYVKDIKYNAKGQIKRIEYGNNTATDYTYGQDLRLSNIRTQGPSQTLQDLFYDFDANGNLEHLTDNLRSNTRTYLYDDLDRLKEAQNTPLPDGSNGTLSFQYDCIGNMVYKSDTGWMNYGEGLSSKGTVPKPHALTQAQGYNYRYDANGNMVQGKNKTLAYDSENRLTQVNEGPTMTSFTYDGDGGRVSKTTIPSPHRGEGQGEGKLCTTYIGSLFEIQDSGDKGQSAVKHIFAGATRIATENLLRASPSEGSGRVEKETFYYHPDHLGSSNVITDQNGSLVQYCEYAPYGVAARNEGTDVVKHKFTGKELDTTGLYYYGARYYDPELGRFITPDTIVQAPYDPQSLNRYAYCRNNPINYVDPSGHVFIFDDLIFAMVIGACIGGAVGGIAAAITGGNIGMGILMGALGGAMVAGGGYTAGAIWGLSWAWAGAAAGGAIGGAANAAISGGNIGIGAVVGAVGAGVGCGVGQIIGGVGGIVAGAIAGTVASAGVEAGFSGGDFGRNLGMNIALSVAGALAGYGISRAQAKTPAQEQSLQRKAADTGALLNEGYAQGGAEGVIAAANEIAVITPSYGKALEYPLSTLGKMALTATGGLSKAAFPIARATARVGGAVFGGITLGTDVANLIHSYQSHAPAFTQIHGWALVISDATSMASGLMGPAAVPLRWLGTGMHAWDHLTQDVFDRMYGNQ